VRQGQRHGLLQGQLLRKGSLLGFLDPSELELGRRSIFRRLGGLLCLTRTWVSMVEGERRGGGGGRTLRLFPGLPRRSFFSAAAFLGGIFLRRRGVEWKLLGWEGIESRFTARRDNVLGMEV
jgi:hypothetical protein